MSSKANKTPNPTMKNPILNNITSTPLPARAAGNLRGLLPPAYLPLSTNVNRCMEQLRQKATPLERYVYLQGIQDVSERLYHAILISHTKEVMPVVYTPTVGEACQKFSKIYRGTVRGMYFSIGTDVGCIREILDNWHTEDVTTIVVTDGERILGLGDLGVNGMGIPIGKLALYTACAGINPNNVLPVTLDIGTNNQGNIDDPYYMGSKHERVRGEKYDAFVAEFFKACQDKFGPNVLIQFEDFGNTNAFRLLHHFQNKACTFNDDIQGTASVALAGLLASVSITQTQLADHTFLFAGAGEAGTGIADLIAYAISFESGISMEEARKKIYLVDSKGLITEKRKLEGGLQHHKLNFAHDVADCETLMEAIEMVKPSSLIGVSAMAKMFDEGVCKKMAEINDRPIISALSNPTSKAECTAAEAYAWTDGKCIFSSGSPFDPVVLEDGRRFVPGQGNNAYIFPGIGLGALAAKSTKITDHDMYIAAKTLSTQVSQEELDEGCLYPSLDRIRSVSANIAVTILKNALETGVATVEGKDGLGDEDLLKYVESLMYDPFEDLSGEDGEALMGKL